MHHTLGQDYSPSATGFARQRLQSHVWIDGTSSTGRRRLLPREGITEILPNGREKDVPAGMMAMVSSSDFLRASERLTAISTLNRQRDITPSCGGFTPTAERRVGPARMIVGEFDTQTGAKSGRSSPLWTCPLLAAERTCRIGRLRSPFDL